MDWFKAWFNTPYYHTLYKNRDNSEAKAFIEKIIDYLHLEKGAKVMDLACGKGRHSITLNENGLDVIGLDLSDESIAYAKKFENKKLAFDVHDMREIYKADYFDVIFNLFTSFGYFDDEQDNFKVFDAVKKQLKANGTFVFDYLNAEKIVANLIPYEEKEIDGIIFKISKSVTENQFIKKEIDFYADEQDWHFEEYVKILYKKDFENLIEQADFKVKTIFGNYKLEPFDPVNSDRLILILENA